MSDESSRFSAGAMSEVSGERARSTADVILALVSLIEELDQSTSEVRGKRAL